MSHPAVLNSELIRRADLYFSLLSRYEKLDVEKAIPLIGIRLVRAHMTGRGFLELICQEGEGPALHKVRGELQGMTDAVKAMMQIVPPGTAAAEGIEQSMNLILESGESEQTATRVRRFCRRLRKKAA